MTATVTEPTLTGWDDDNEDPVHLFCCDENIAMCGVDLTDHDFVPDDAPDEDTCRLCVIVEQNGWACPVPGCEGNAA